MTTVAREETRTVAKRSYHGGLALALVSASSFGLSGSLARSLLDLGWSPAAVVATRVGGAFLILLIPCLVLIRRIGLPTRGQSLRMLAYGVVAIALAQLCYFSAVQYLSVGVALLLEFLAPVMLIGWHWARTHRRPTGSVLVGAGLSIVGLAFVLDLREGLTLNPIGVAWALGAALCLCAYFLLSEDSGTDAPVHPLLLTTAGTGIGAGVLLAAAAAGLLPLAASGGVTILADRPVSWWIPILMLILISAVLAYPAGIVGVRRLGSSLASFVSLTEVIFAVIFALVLLGQRPGPMQLLGGVLILAGIALVQRPARTKVAAEPTGLTPERTPASRS
jgi:drug/metabolite transporter (DMT)-like permease